MGVGGKRKMATVDYWIDELTASVKTNDGLQYDG
jgi:hypothetical protein